jgi:hypothetical protein
MIVIQQFQEIEEQAGSDELRAFGEKEGMSELCHSLWLVTTVKVWDLRVV